MIRPGFFIIGARKCGTTALSEYLRAHPRIGFSVPKEPHYFATYLDDRYRWVHTESDYLTRCFRNSTPEHPAVGEGSALYLYSHTAVDNILTFAPEARFVVMLRNPWQMIYA